MEEDIYKTLAAPGSETLFKDKGSKFLGYAYPIASEEQAKQIISELKKTHHSARHWCYAWKLGVDPVRYRANDDGEPGNSAGQPIFGQILAADVTDVLVVVVRYFGGVKLGVGGLIRAYKTAAQYALEASTIVSKVITEELTLIFDYEHMDKIMRIVKQKKLTIRSQEMNEKCTTILSVNKSQFLGVKNAFLTMHFLKVK